MNALEVAEIRQRLKIVEKKLDELSERMTELLDELKCFDSSVSGLMAGSTWESRDD